MRFWPFKRRVYSMPLDVEEPQEWHIDDARAWRGFLRSSTGRKLQGHIFFAIYQRALLAARKDEYENGVDKGQNAIVGRLMHMAEVDYYRQLEEPDEE